MTEDKAFSAIRPAPPGRTPYGPFLIHDMVFAANCSPAVGRIKRMAKDGSWAEVEWQYCERTKGVKRMNIDNIRLLNPVLNDFVIAEREEDVR